MNCDGKSDGHFFANVVGSFMSDPDIVPAMARVGRLEENCPMRKTLIAAALFGFTAWAIVTFAMMVSKWTSQVQGKSASSVSRADHK